MGLYPNDTWDSLRIGYLVARVINQLPSGMIQVGTKLSVIIIEPLKLKLGILAGNTTAISWKLLWYHQLHCHITNWLDFIGIYWEYPLIISNNHGKWSIYTPCTSWKWWCSIAICESTKGKWIRIFHCQAKVDTHFFMELLSIAKVFRTSMWSQKFIEYPNVDNSVLFLAVNSKVSDVYPSSAAVAPNYWPQLWNA